MSTDPSTLLFDAAAPLFTVFAGMAFASFIGSLSYRLPREVSIVAPRSYCSACGRPIRAFDLVPVASYLLLRGRCRECGAPIPFQYFAAEILLPAAYLLMYLRFAPGPEFFVYCCLASVLLYLSLLDIDWREVGLLDALLPYGGAASLLALSATGAVPDPPSHYLLGAAAAAALAGLSFLLVRLVRKRLPMGAADLIVIPAVGLHFGVMGALRVMVFSSLIGVAVGAIVALAGRGGRETRLETRLPMLPFLAGGVLGEVLWELLRPPF